MYNEKTNQRTTKMTLLRKEEGWRRFQIKAITLVLGKERVSTNVMHPTELIVLGTVLKNEIATITNEAVFTTHRIIGYDNPRLHWHPIFC